VKVLDFGVSKVTLSGETECDQPMTTTSSIVGSPQYMSPEQLSTPQDVDARSDIWALGAVLYRLVTARLPFDAPTLPQLCTAILHGALIPPRKLVPELPRDFEALIMRCLDRRRDRRFGNVAQLVAALTPFSPDSASHGPERSSKLAIRSWSRTAPGDTHSRNRSLRTYLPIVIAAVLAVASAAGGRTWLARDRALAPSPSAGSNPRATPDASAARSQLLPALREETGPSSAMASQTTSSKTLVLASSASKARLAPRATSSATVKKAHRVAASTDPPSAAAPPTSPSALPTSPPSRASKPHSPLDGRR
jgi:serine/threonine-protein kinase